MRFLGGFSTGGMADFASNWDKNWPCVSDVTAVVETGYLVYTYINEYMST
jgi:hypothetical protein